MKNNLCFFQLEIWLAIISTNALSLIAMTFVFLAASTKVFAHHSSTANTRLGAFSESVQVDLNRL